MEEKAKTPAIEAEKKYALWIDHFLEELLKHEKLNPPFNVKGDIGSDFSERCRIYLALIDDSIKKDINGCGKYLKTLRVRVENIQKCLQKTLEEYLSGDIKTAYDIFDEVMSKEATITQLNHISILLKDICNEKKPLYRVRKSETPLVEHDEIFHIPFSKRYLVNAQRYSVAGQPCLYLGTSLYVCWQEMGKPDFDKLYISSFITNDTNSKILNFASPHLSLPIKKPENDSLYFSTNRTKASYFIFWPLLIACNYLKSKENSSFTSEYIVPNLLMQWIGRRVKSPIAGIAYYSTKMPKSRNSKHSINVVLPPKASYKQSIQYEFCPKLSSYFEFTPPMSWQVLKTLDYQSHFIMSNEQSTAINYLKKKEKLSGIANFEEDIVNLYPLTDFYKLEILVDRLFKHLVIKQKTIL
ncbi:TPA: hypothetical protein J1Z19_003440 [Escherichia coli]|nr:hypothetical protein [Escherichia coli]MCJ2574067.1 hypothetical protein [Escherichia coli]HBA7645830.1 hypothetical protein [Escherichia coli]HBA7653997.1 hypothetical protein [Escherichia coli]HBA7727077.1 hypothetical protein [Escherichia coli]